MFQIDEQLMADNRALITINSNKADISRFHKPGMLNYVVNSGQNDLFLSTPRTRDHDEFVQIMTKDPDGKLPNDMTFKGNITVEGTLSVLGSSTVIDTTNLTIEDNIIEINKNETGPGIALISAGIQVNRGIKPIAGWLFKEEEGGTGIGAFIFDIGGNIKTWIYDTGDFKTLGNLDTQIVTAQGNILGKAGMTIDLDSLLKGALTVNGIGSFTGTLNATGATWLKNSLQVDAAATINSSLSVVGNYATTLGGSLGVTGAATFSSTVGVTGIITGPTASVDTDTTQLATTAFVLAQAGSANPLMNNVVAVGTSTRFARQDHVHPVDTSRVATSITINGHALTGNVSVTATDLSLGNVTNESKATMFTNPTFTGTVAGVTATHVGLGSVTNESKSTMFTDAALTGTPTAPTASTGTNTTQIASTAFVKQEITAGGFALSGHTHTGITPFEQVATASTWTINHTGSYPSVVAVDATGLMMTPTSIQYTSATQIIIIFPTAVAGKAYLN